jgi:hypothetical protein
MKNRRLGSLGLCLAFLASTISFVSAPASATPDSPKVIFPSANEFVTTSVVGDRLFIQNNSLDLYYVDSKMKSQKLKTQSNIFATPIEFLEYFENKIFITKTCDKKEKNKLCDFQGTKLVSLDQKNKLKTVALPVPKNSDYCSIIASLGQKLYLGCYWRDPKTYKFTNTLFVSSPSGSISEVKLPMQGNWRPAYLGSQEIMFQLTESGKSPVHHFYALNENGNLSKQFNVVSSSLPTVKIVSRTQNGWILQGKGLIKSRSWECEQPELFTETFFVGSDGVLSTLGTVAPNESVHWDDHWISNERFYFDREIIDAKGCIIRNDRYEVNQDGQSTKIASARTLTRKLNVDPIGESDLGLRWDLVKPSEELIRWQAAFEICPSISKGKAKGMTMFNGHAICKQGATLMAYPYSGWTMPKEPERIFPKIKETNSNLQLELRKAPEASEEDLQQPQLEGENLQPIQPAGIGDPAWSVKCPVVIDTVKALQPKVLGFKFDGTGQTFTRLVNGNFTPSLQPDNLVGCYANLYDFNANPKTANGWQIGSINRDSSGYYWTNAAGVRWGLTLSGSILTTDKDNPYYDKGRQFITL